MNTGTTGGPTLLRPDEAHRAWASGPGSQGLPRDLVRQATPRLRVMALLYAAVFFLAAFFPSLISEAERAILFSAVVRWLPGAISISVALFVAAVVSTPRDAEKSKKGAKEMIDGFGLAVPPNSTNAPALLTNHTPGKAIDMDIAWIGAIRTKKKDGTEESVLFMGDVNNNMKLHAIGASYGVRKLTTDAPHWSLDGH
jgi:hypothetical protein